MFINRLLLLTYQILMHCNKTKVFTILIFYFETFHHPARGCLIRDCVKSSNLVLAEIDTDTTLLMLFSYNLCCLWRETYVETTTNQ